MLTEQSWFKQLNKTTKRKYFGLFLIFYHAVYLIATLSYIDLNYSPFFPICILFMLNFLQFFWFRFRFRFFFLSNLIFLLLSVVMSISCLLFRYEVQKNKSDLFYIFCQLLLFLILPGANLLYVYIFLTKILLYYFIIKRVVVYFIFLQLG